MRTLPLAALALLAISAPAMAKYPAQYVNATDLSAVPAEARATLSTSLPSWVPQPPPIGSPSLTIQRRGAGRQDGVRKLGEFSRITA
jgi:hypothetical protein